MITGKTYLEELTFLGFSERGFRCLKTNNIKTIEDFTQLSINDMHYKLKGVGNTIASEFIGIQQTLKLYLLSQKREETNKESKWVESIFGLHNLEKFSQVYMKPGATDGIYTVVLEYTSSKKGNQILVFNSIEKAEAFYKLVKAKLL